ncbi:hypothetical protein AMECASPLE_036472 [Ameca splendens]|uniref:Uncharacterized protein n=1 Tax=Ameca splendens TaxID=208324 RepID=A0ABV0ZIW3_9TELE
MEHEPGGARRQISLEQVNRIKLINRQNINVAEAKHRSMIQELNCETDQQTQKHPQIITVLELDSITTSKASTMVLMMMVIIVMVMMIMMMGRSVGVAETGD